MVRAHKATGRRAAGIALAAVLLASATAAARSANGRNVSAATTARHVSSGRFSRAYEYIEHTRITQIDGGRRRMLAQFAASMLIQVETVGTTVTVSLQPNPERTRRKEKDPVPGRIAATQGGDQPTLYPIRPLRVSFRFAPSDEGSVSVEGLPARIAAEALPILNQGPASNAVRPRSVIPYQLGIATEGRPVVLRGQQRNGDLWVDWSLQGSGTVGVGDKGWELPIKFVLQPLRYENVDGLLRFRAEADMRYSSVRVGPQDVTTLRTEITHSQSGATLVCVRQVQLRPVEGIAFARPAAAASADGLQPVGGAAAWSRLGALATLGVQRLSGVPETGLAVWVAQLAVDHVRSEQIDTVLKLDRTLASVQGKKRELPDLQARQTRGVTVTRGFGVRAGLAVPLAADDAPDFDAAPQAELNWRPLDPEHAFGVELSLGMAQFSAGADGSDQLLTARAVGTWRMHRGTSLSPYLFAGPGLTLERTDIGGTSESSSAALIEAVIGARLHERLDIRAAYTQVIDSDQLDALVGIAVGVEF